MRAHISQSRRIILCLISLLSLPFCSAIFFQECRDPDQEGHTQNYCPTIRYCSWNHYSSVPRSFLETGVGYDESSWNLEKDSQSLVDQTRFGALDEHVQLKLELLGYDEDKHDCCNNHYEDYDWEDFDIDDGLGMVLAALELIGYDETTWNAEDGVSEYEDYTWEELPREIQFAATYSLCYTKETWDEIPLSEWSIDTILPGSYDLGNHDTKTTSNTVLESTEENADNEGDKKLWDDDDNMPPNTYNDDLIQDLSNKVNDPAYIQEP